MRNNTDDLTEKRLSRLNHYCLINIQYFLPFFTERTRYNNNHNFNKVNDFFSFQLYAFIVSNYITLSGNSSNYLEKMKKKTNFFSFVCYATKICIHNHGNMNQSNPFFSCSLILALFCFIFFLKSVVCS